MGGVAPPKLDLPAVDAEAVTALLMAVGGALTVGGASIGAAATA